MPSRSSKLLLTALGVVAFLSLGAPAQAAETSNSEFVIIRPDDVVADDLYAGAIKVSIEGRLEGDLTAFAADEVVIDGTVTGSVYAVAPRVIINGQVGGSVRASGRSLTIEGSVGGDVVAAVWSASLATGSEIGGDTLLWAWNAEALGSIGEDLGGTQRNLALAGSVAGDVDVSVHRLDVVDALKVTGDLDYRSNREATGLDQADVGGVVVKKTPLAPNLRVRALALLGRFMVVLFLTVAALTVAYGWPERTALAVGSVAARPLRRWLAGASVIFAPLLAIALTGLLLGLAPPAAAFPLLAVLIPVILALFGLSAALGLVAGAPVVAWLGDRVFRRFDVYGSIVAGAALVGLAWYVPWVGWLVPLVILPLGLGAWMAALGQTSSGPGPSDGSDSSVSDSLHSA
jgi:cytoskeletal protein CcmA (bactofilin family)